MIDDIIRLFGLHSTDAVIKPFGTGLINRTWLISMKDNAYILQKVNDNIFKQPRDIADNIELIGSYLRKHHPEYYFISPLNDIHGNTIVHDKDKGYFRLFPFVKNSHTVDVVRTAQQAFEAAAQFGKFTSVLEHFPIDQLHITLPNFHDLTLRHQQFQQAIKHGNAQRIGQTHLFINALHRHEHILKTFQRIQRDKSFKLRVTHHDTKISNVLFDPEERGICVIDLDTVMPGYFFSDVGDMMRTYLCPVNEEESDLDMIEIRDEFLEAIIHGYSSQMKSSLTDVEKDHFIFAGQFMIYMQALRFLTDYLNDDAYYQITYPEQNRIRAANQICLLEKLEEKATRWVF